MDCPSHLIEEPAIDSRTTCPETRLTVAIVSWNTRDLLMGTLASIYDSPPPFPVQTVVVDNASADGSARAVSEGFPQVTLVANSENAGYARGNNQALAVASGRYCLLLNPDVVLSPCALTRAVAFLDAHPEAGALGARQLYPNGSLQPSLRGFPTPLAVLWELVGLSRLFPKSRIFGAYRMAWFGYDRVMEADQPMGTFLMLRATALQQIGPLDERFPIFFNEVDWCLRCKRAGWKIYFAPDVEIIHYGGASTSQVGAAMAWESRRGLLEFYHKHYAAPQYLPMRLLVMALSWPHAWWQSRRRR